MSLIKVADRHYSGRLRIDKFMGEVTKLRMRLLREKSVNKQANTLTVTLDISERAHAFASQTNKPRRATAWGRAAVTETYMTVSDYAGIVERHVFVRADACSEEANRVISALPGWIVGTVWARSDVFNVGVFLLVIFLLTVLFLMMIFFFFDSIFRYYWLSFFRLHWYWLCCVFEWFAVSLSRP